MLRDVAPRVRPAQLALLLALVLTVVAVVSPRGVGARPSWWPDPPTKTGLAVWLNETYEDQDFVSQLADALQRQGIDVVFVQISSAAATPNLQKLSDRDDPFTRDVQNLLVDHVVAFNNNRDDQWKAFHVTMRARLVSLGSDMAR